MLAKKKYLFLILGLMISLIILIVIFLVSINTSLKQPLNAELSNTKLTLTGFNNPFNPTKTTININDITDISLNSPPIVILANEGGGQSGNKIYGTENIEGIGSTSSYIEDSKNKYIYIKTNTKTYIINFSNITKTISLYNQLKANITQ